MDEIISQLKQNGGYTEIVKNSKPAAVIVDPIEFYKLLPQFRAQLLNNQSEKQLHSNWKLRGSLEAVGDLEEASKDVSKSILDSIKKLNL